MGKKGTHSVKKRAENCTKQKCTQLFVGGVLGCEPLGQKRVLVEKWLMLCLSTEVKPPCVCKPLYEMGTADALDSLMKARCVLYRTHVYKKKSPSGMANHATGRDA